VNGDDAVPKNRLLVVEDDVDISEIIAMNMQYSGYEYITIDDGGKAAEYLRDDHAFDLAVLDIMLPGLDGFELMEYMRKYDIPVLYLTAKADVGSKIKGLRGGAEDYLVKPFEVLELLVRIEKILARTGKLDKILRCRDIVIDVETRTVRKCGEAVYLQPIEYDLMVALIRHKNCSLSRERLLSEIWGFEYAGETRTVDTHISSLRRKLDLVDAIVSVPKVGYRLQED
jgi:DNA-binding response OmpR family regulator